MKSSIGNLGVLCFCFDQIKDIHWSLWTGLASVFMFSERKHAKNASRLSRSQSAVGSRKGGVCCGESESGEGCRGGTLWTSQSANVHRNLRKALLCLRFDNSIGYNVDSLLYKCKFLKLLSLIIENASVQIVLSSIMFFSVLWSTVGNVPFWVYVVRAHTGARTCIAMLVWYLSG